MMATEEASFWHPPKRLRHGKFDYKYFVLFKQQATQRAAVGRGNGIGLVAGDGSAVWWIQRKEMNMRSSSPHYPLIPIWLRR